MQYAEIYLFENHFLVQKFGKFVGGGKFVVRKEIVA